MALFIGKIEIERAPFMLPALFPHMERRPLYYNTFVKPPYQVWKLGLGLPFQHPKDDFCQCYEKQQMKNNNFSKTIHLSVGPELNLDTKAALRTGSLRRFPFFKEMTLNKKVWNFDTSFWLCFQCSFRIMVTYLANQVSVFVETLSFCVSFKF